MTISDAWEVEILDHIFNNAAAPAVALSTPSLAHLDPPMVFTRADGEALSAQVQGNDAAAALTLGINGWTEEDVDTN